MISTVIKGTRETVPGRNAMVLAEITSTSRKASQFLELGSNHNIKLVGVFFVF